MGNENDAASMRLHFEEGGNGNDCLCLSKEYVSSGDIVLLNLTHLVKEEQQAHKIPQSLEKENFISSTPLYIRLNFAFRRAKVGLQMLQMIGSCALPTL